MRWTSRVLLPALLFGAGCPGPPRPAWEWTSEAGRLCFESCRAGTDECAAGCRKRPGDDPGLEAALSFAGCRHQERECMRSCPDLRQAGGE